MKTYLTIKKNQKFYWFIITFLSIEIFLKILFSFSNISGFSLTPYMRLGLIFFTILFFSIDILKITIPRKLKTSKISYKNIFVFGWFIFAFISIFIGVLNKNPSLYVATDFIYIFLGTLLFYITERRNNNDEITNRFFIFFSRILIVLSLVCFCANFNTPSLLLILMVILIYINILKKRVLEAFFLLIPYFILVVSTNRSQLIIFFLMIFILFIKKFRNYFTIKIVVFIGLSIVILVFILKHQVLDSILFFVNPKSNMGYRINQIAVILNEGIDYSNPFFISISQRIIESQVVVTYWTENIVTFLFGLGSGATIDGSKFYNDGSVLNSALLGANKIHNIHLLPFALVFRYGVVGLLLFCLLLLMVYKSFIKVLNENNDISKIFWNLFLVFWFFFSIPAASFLWSMPVFWLSLSMVKKE